MSINAEASASSERPKQITLADVIDELTEPQVRRIVALMGLARPRPSQAAASEAA